MKFGWVLIVVFVLIGNCCIAQEIKKFTATRTDYSPKIDGILNDRIWNEVKAASGFIEIKPIPGRAESYETSS